MNHFILVNCGGNVFPVEGTEHQSFTKRILYFQLQEINTLDDKKVEFFDDKSS